MLHPLVKSCLFKLYCLSLYGCSLWNLSCHSLCSIELSLNNILRCIWNLSRNCHTGILHLTTLLPSIFNVVQSRSSTLPRCQGSWYSLMNLYQVFVTFLSYNNCERCFPTNNPSQITVKVKFNTVLQ